MKIMIVEDDLLIRNQLKKELEQWEYTIIDVEDFSKTLSIFEDSEPDLVLMDIKLPIYDGYHFTKRIRSISSVPIIFISSRSDNMDQIMALEMGADDFISKPFDMDFLITKIKSSLRRAYTYDSSDKKDALVLIIYINGFKELRYDEFKYTLSFDERTVELTKTENTIFKKLVNNIGNYVTRDSLIQQCWQGDDYIDENTLFVNISRLRKKLSSIGLDNFITTKKNVGYRIENANL